LLFQSVDNTFYLSNLDLCHDFVRWIRSFYLINRELLFQLRYRGVALPFEHLPMLQELQ
jgi:hypothetical protein